MIVRPETSADRAAIRAVVTAAFGREAEADLVDSLRTEGDLVLSLVAEEDQAVVGHIAFSRLLVESDAPAFPAVALAPLVVAPIAQRQGVGARLVACGHEYLAAASETLSVVLGEPRYYTRFGYRRDLAAAFRSPYQCDALLAIAFGGAPRDGWLRYAAAFERL